MTWVAFNCVQMWIKKTTKEKSSRKEKKKKTNKLIIRKKFEWSFICKENHFSPQVHLKILMQKCVKGLTRPRSFTRAYPAIQKICKHSAHTNSFIYPFSPQSTFTCCSFSHRTFTLDGEIESEIETLKSCEW